jgi:hypothetical protein
MDLEKLTAKDLQVRIASVEPNQGELIRMKKIILYETGKYGSNVEGCSQQDLALLFTKDPIGEGKRIELSKRSEDYGETAEFYGNFYVKIFSLYNSIQVSAFLRTKLRPNPSYHRRCRRQPSP